MLLMISVLNASEAREAIVGGADILDVKNPAEGSLGANFPRVIREIRKISAPLVKMSAAIGDLPNLPGTASLAALGAAVSGADYVKVGLWGPMTEAEAVFLLREVREAVRDFPNVSVIAAGYADARRSGSLDPQLLPRITLSAGVTGCLLDTAIKDGCSLFDFLKPEALRALAEEAHAAGLLYALAGALKERDLRLVRQIGADVVGLRSAACQEGQRNGPLDVQRVRRLRAILSRPPQPAGR